MLCNRWRMSLGRRLINGPLVDLFIDNKVLLSNKNDKTILKAFPKALENFKDKN